MKKLLFLIACSILCCSCDKDQFDKDDPSVLEKDSFSDGVYMGYFVLQDQNYWCDIEFTGDCYEEWPSGGVMYQKEISCLTTGTFNVENSILSFKLNSYKFPAFPASCHSEMILPGDYKIHLLTTGDSLVFSKGTGNDKIKYYLVRVIK